MSKWVKFDKNDKSTWPPLREGKLSSEYVVLRNDSDCACIGYRCFNPKTKYDYLYNDFPRMDFDSWTVTNVTHWLELPIIDDLKVCQGCAQLKSHFESDSIEKDPYSTCAVCGEIITTREDSQ